MTLPFYLFKKFLNALVICGSLSYSIFFIFSLIGNLGEKFSFQSILYLSALNSFQIFTYIPSHLFIISFCLFIINLKSRNELKIIKIYLNLTKLILIIFPITLLFLFIELNKDMASSNIEEIKSNLIHTQDLKENKILIERDENKKTYKIFIKSAQNSFIINQFLGYEVLGNNILRGELSSNLKLNEKNLYSYSSTIYENNEFYFEKSEKKLFENFMYFWSKNPDTIIKRNLNILDTKYTLFYAILFSILFYLCIAMIFLSKELLNRSFNILKVFFLVISIFLYHLMIPKIIINNYQYHFQILSLIILLMFFLKIKKNA